MPGIFTNAFYDAASYMDSVRRNITSAQLSEQQRADAIERCAAENFKINKNRFTLDQERARCGGTIRAVLVPNDKEGAAQNPLSPDNSKLILFAAAGIGLLALFLKARK
jgi:hypothetical protein